MAGRAQQQIVVFAVGGGQYLIDQDDAGGLTVDAEQVLAGVQNGGGVKLGDA